METTASEPQLQIELIAIKKAVLIFRAINHPLRQHMLQLLHKNARMTVTDLYVKLRLEQSVASQHLAILRGAQFVKTERNGKNIFYSVNYQQLEKIHTISRELLDAGKLPSKRVIADDRAAAMIG
jgi:DNA-binding transcriptional ArsR family regulator